MFRPTYSGSPRRTGETPRQSMLDLLGARQHIDTESHELLLDGKIGGAIGAGRNVTFPIDTTGSAKLIDALYENSGEAILITGPDNSIISVNPRFTKMTGYTLDEVVGKTPHLLSSGLQDIAFYAEMFRQLHEKGSWQGRITNRKKNGDLYVGDLTINRILNEDGSIFRHIAQYSDVTPNSEDLIWKEANFDALTGLPNRRLFHNRLDQEIKKISRTTGKIFLTFLDLDHFKEVNDTLGHLKGDMLLVDASRRIKSCLREADTVARMGGDEFIIILTDVTGIDVERICNDILGVLITPFNLGNGDIVHISCSIGIAVFPDHAAKADELIRYADMAMYASKSSGRNRFGFCTDAMTAMIREKQKLVNALKKAVCTNELKIYCQPIVDLKTGMTAKIEVFLRWRHGRSGLVDPPTFVPLAEEAGLLTEIAKWTLQEIVSCIKQSKDETGKCIQAFIHTNSKIQIENFPMQHLKDCIEAAGLSPECIVINIPERLLLKESTTTKTQLKIFHESGIRVAYDNFGVGFSSLSHLKDFDIDYVEIDKSLIHAMTESEPDMAIVETIILIAKRLGIKTIAEGV